jgi:hypothetical protein
MVIVVVVVFAVEGFKVLIPVLIESSVFLDITSYPVKDNRRFGGTHSIFKV